jgi:hypothetical protein
MATTLNNFVNDTQLAASATALESTTSSEKKFVGSASVTNTSTSNIEVTIWLLPTTTSATTGSGGNWIYRKTIPAGRTERVEAIIGQVIDKSMTLSGSAGTASVVNINISGTTET